MLCQLEKISQQCCIALFIVVASFYNAVCRNLKDVQRNGGY